MLEGFLFYYNFVSANSCGFARRGGTRSSEGRFPLLALLPSGHGERAVARVAGKAPAADRLSQTAASNALSPKANSSSVCLRRLKFYMPQPSVPNGGGS